MLYPDNTQQKLMQAIVSLGARSAAAAELNAVLEAGRAAKPAGYDDTVKGMALRFAGDQVAIISAKLAERYPNSSPMPVNPVNLLAHFARSDAGVYIADADRVVVDGGKVLPAQDVLDDKGNVKEPGDEGAAGFAAVLEDIGMLQLMPQAERRVLTGAKAAVVEICWRKISDDDDGVATGHIYWTNDVIAICHPTAPMDDRAIMVFGVRQTPTSSPAGLDSWWVWSREPTENADGTVAKWGKWGHCRISTDGKHQSLRQEYPGELLPFAILRIEQGDGSFWPTPEKDVLAQVDELNVSRANEQHTVNLQGHSQVIVFGTLGEADELKTGPDVFVRAGPGERAEVLNFNPKLKEMLESRSEATREIALSRANNPDTYATTKSAQVSGLSRAIANLPHDQRIRELRPIFRAFEEKRLLPIIREAIDLFAPASHPARKLPKTAVARVVFGASPDYEELDARQRRLKEDRDDGIITDARYAVLMGHFDNIPAAVAAGLSNTLKVTKPASPFGAAPGAPPKPAADDAGASDGAVDGATE